MDKPRDGGNEHCFAVAASKGAKMIATLSAGLVERQIVARGEELGMTPTQFEESVRDEQLLTPSSQSPLDCVKPAAPVSLSRVRRRFQSTGRRLSGSTRLKSQSSPPW